MDLIYTYLLYLLVVNIQTLTAQFLPIARKQNKANACDGANKTVLVEQFFNVIFTEFQNNPPVCVCVQMCADQPTYCYPNMCLKKVDNKRKIPEENKPTAPVNIQDSNLDKMMFLVENDFSRLSNENVDSKNFLAETFSIKDVRPDPFKDRYKSMTKYKKMPKVELRYNLREQVKNMKSDIFNLETQDVSKTRWPKTNHMAHREQQKFKIADKPNDKMINAASSFFMQSLGIERDLYSPKFFKRDVRRNTKDDIDAASEFSPETTEPSEAKTFSLETLIENLIGNNFVRRPDGDLELKTLNDSQTPNNVVNATENTSNNMKNDDDKDITCVLSLNMTNENVDENKYEENPVIKKHLDKWKNFTFNEMITALSKKIDKQNNTSMELIKNISGDKIEISITGPVKSLKDKDQLNILDETVASEIVLNKTETVSSTESHIESGNVNETLTTVES